MARLSGRQLSAKMPDMRPHFQSYSYAYALCPADHAAAVDTKSPQERDCRDRSPVSRHEVARTSRQVTTKPECVRRPGRPVAETDAKQKLPVAPGPTLGRPGCVGISIASAVRLKGRPARKCVS